MLFVKSNAPILLFTCLSPPTSGNRFTEDRHNYLVITQSRTNVQIFVYWKQRIFELEIEYSFDPDCTSKLLSVHTYKVHLITLMVGYSPKESSQQSPSHWGPLHKLAACAQPPHHPAQRGHQHGTLVHPRQPECTVLTVALPKPKSSAHLDGCNVKLCLPFEVPLQCLHQH